MNLLKDIENTHPIQESEIPSNEAVQETSLIKELSVVNKPASIQGDLKKSDKTDAGTYDVIDKAKASQDVSFNLMRNTINANGNVTGSDVANYVERAEELNDEVDTVPFGLETDDGQIVKVYVNAEQADKFEEAMKNMLGLEDDIEEAINRLTTEFDIVDVVWPTSPDGEDEDEDADLEIDDTSNLQLDPEDDEDFADDNYEVVGAAAKDEKKASAEEEDDIAAAAKADEEESEDDGEKASKDDEEEEEVGADGKPKKKKKKKKAQPAEPVEDEEVKESKERVADSPSIAAAIKKMTSTGKHIAAMDEGPDNTVYIEDSEGVEYVMRGDKHLRKEKHGKKLTSYSKRDKVQENEMTTVGSKFLQRVTEAVEDRDGVKDGFNIPLDSQARALAAKLKLPFAKRLIAFHVMAGVPGRYLNTEDAENAIGGAADMLRKKISVRRAFMSLYDGLANAKGYTIPDEKTNEAKGDDQEYTTFAAWKRAARKHEGVWFDGDEDIANAMIGEKPYKRGKTRSVGEWDGAVGWLKKPVVAEAKQKRGSFIQKLFETVLVELGLPQSLVTTTGPSAVGTGIYRTAELIEQDGTLERALRLLATRLGIRQSEAAGPVSEAKKPKDDDGKPITVQGVKGMKSTPFQKTFRNQEAMEKWMEKHGDDVTIHRYSTNESDERFSRLSKMSVGLDEAVDVGNDEFAQAVVKLVAALGIPDDVLQRRRTQIVQALRAKKATLGNRAQILTLMTRLNDSIEKNTRKPGPNDAGQQNEGLVNEGVDEILQKIATATGGNMGVVRAVFVGGSSSGMDRYVDKLEKAGFDSSGGWVENAQYFKKIGISKSEYNQLVKASL